MIVKRGFYLILLTAALLVLGFTPTLLAQEAKVDLSLNMLPEYYYKEIIPAKVNTLFMEIKNNGENEITNISFNSDKPEGWEVEFQPGNINALSAGSSQTIEVTVIPDIDTGRGDYNLTFLAEAEQTRAVTSAMLRVENGSLFWLWVGLGITALVIAGFAVIFLRSGKQ